MNSMCWVIVVVLLYGASVVQGEEDIMMSGGGEYDISMLETPISAQERQAIQAILDRNIQVAGKLTSDSTASILLTSPLTSSLADFGYHAISNFVDQNAAFPDQLQDYNCGARTYDRDNGYNHQGIDFALWPFPWFKMDHDQVHVVAAAPGTIVAKQDGNFDRNCSSNSSTWNAVYLQHIDGSVAWYGHLKEGSLTSKAIGDFVERGEYLGVVGSSGRSTGPHLHFEIHDANGNLIDPFGGSCNEFNNTSWWEQQVPYYDSAINLLMTGSESIEIPSCPSPEIQHNSDTFRLDSRIYFTTFYRDQLAGQESQYTILRPDGSIYYTWSHSSSEPHYAASWWWWTIDFAKTVPQGDWIFQVEYEDRLYTHTFTIGTINTAVENVTEMPNAYRLSEVYPNPFNAATRFTLQVIRSQHVRIAVYDLLGRPVEVLYEGQLAANAVHDFTFEASPLSSGVYLLRVIGETFTEVQPVTVLK